jgi:hypothetical protein
MTDIKKSLRGVRTVDASDDPTTPKSAVTQFIQSTLLAQNSNGLEKTILDFEDNSIESNFKYLVDSDKGNPLEYGLKAIDAMSKVVAGKNQSGVSQFNTLPNITVDKIRKSTAEELVPFILDTLEMTTPVTDGLNNNNRGNALGFSLLSLAIANELKRGGEIYNKFISDVRRSGQNTIKEWVNHGSR